MGSTENSATCPALAVLAPPSGRESTPCTSSAGETAQASAWWSDPPHEPLWAPPLGGGQGGEQHPRAPAVGMLHGEREMPKNYYPLLGVSSGASAQDIRAAYHRLAERFRTDLYASGGRPFLEIQEAYSVLRHPDQRRAYDRQTDRQPTQPEPLVPDAEPADLGTIVPIHSFDAHTPSMDEVSDWTWSNFSGRGQPKSQPVKSLTLEVLVPPEEARRGGHVKVMVPARASCPNCHGHGGIGHFECIRCGGEGTVVGQLPISVAFPPFLMGEHAVSLSLDHFGIHNLYFTVLFRPTGLHEV